MYNFCFVTCSFMLCNIFYRFIIFHLTEKQNHLVCTNMLWKNKFIIVFAMILFCKNTIISPNFLVRKFFGKAQFLHSFRRSSETMGKLCFFTKFPQQEIRWNYVIFCLNFCMFGPTSTHFRLRFQGVLKYNIDLK